MIEILKNNYRKARSSYQKLKFYYSVNWTKTLCFNFKKFPLSIAKKLPVFFYGKVKFASITGKIEIKGEIKKGMIGFGQRYEMNTLHKGIAEINILGTLVFKGHVQFGKDYFIYIGENGYCEFGHMASLASNAKLICMERIVLGNYARFGSESQIMDTNFHQMIDTQTGKKFKMTDPILIGNYNYAASRVTVMQNTKTPDYCTIASNSLCNTDYTSFGSNVLIGGIPAKFIKDSVSRDWEGEKTALDDYLIV
ncbi:acyltransferase [Flavobacterium gawalongense]|uniref:Transferase n=1 Tax=Flavobacterium gawalongense TaxID=2594432 RepID=A0A553BQX6_9FLAO|nr:transferase [Flavobacterium gawalongense]TRX10627.1 transferase [Flavobacterium gawalongense]TRX11776.1 transferase [Flavobacterium gawalongense]TRX29568.1 transferase [Flavobacterium gawalongense]